MSKKEKAKLLHITAKHKINGKSVNLFYYSIKQAALFNKDFTDFKEVGFATTAQLVDKVFGGK